MTSELEKWVDKREKEESKYKGIYSRRQVFEGFIHAVKVLKDAEILQPGRDDFNMGVDTAIAALYRYAGIEES